MIFLSNHITALNKIEYIRPISCAGMYSCIKYTMMYSIAAALNILTITAAFIKAS